MKNIDVVVLAASANGLGAVRSLHDKNLEIAIIVRSELDPSMFSRYPVSKQVLKTNLDISPEQQLVNMLLAMPAGVVVIPTSDWFVSILDSHRALLLAHCRYSIPSQKITNILIDKSIETKIVGEIVPIPKTIQSIESAAQLEQELGFPIIIKPRSHEHMVLKAKNIIVQNTLQLEAFFEAFGDKLEHIVAQEVILGADSQQWVCNCFFDKESNLIQAFTFNRLRLSPSHYGVTSFARSQFNPAVIDLVKELGSALSYVGPAMVEFKFDTKDDTYKYIEINPRLGLCNYFDAQCGINNAYAYYQLSIGEEFSTLIPTMQDNVYFISAYEDWFSRLQDGENLTSILKDYLAIIPRKKVYIYFNWQDPMPGIRLAFKQLQAIAKSLIKRVTK